MSTRRTLKVVETSHVHPHQAGPLPSTTEDRYLHDLCVCWTGVSSGVVWVLEAACGSLRAVEGGGCKVDLIWARVRLLRGASSRGGPQPGYETASAQADRRGRADACRSCVTRQERG